MEEQYHQTFGTVNPSKRHWPMAMRVQSGTPVMCMAMDPLEQIDCVPTSYGAKPRQDSPTSIVSVWSTVMMSKSLIERSIWWVSR